MNDYSYSGHMDALGMVMVLYVGILAALLLLMVTEYFCLSVALSKLGRKRGVSMPQKAWIPFFGKLYVIGELGSSPEDTQGGRQLAGIGAVALLVILISMSNPGMASFFLTLGTALVWIAILGNARYRLYQKCGDKAVLRAALSLIIPLYFAVTMLKRSRT